MRCEIVAVGTELLLGQIVDTNSAWLGEQLALAGIDCTNGQTVGDNQERMVDAIALALSRSDAVVVCGGLGPTQDDITREAIAAVMGVRLVQDDDVADRVLEMFASRGRRMPANNLRQAMVPEGATAIADPQPGTAPGLICPVGDGVVYALPGVPYEMKAIFLGAVIPDLQRRSGQPAVIRSRTLRTWGESESGLAERLADHVTELDASGTVTLAYLASGIEGLKVRMTVKAATDAEAEAVLDAEEAVLRGMLGSLVFGIDGMGMEHAVAALLEERGLTLAVAESLTGGLVAARLVNVPGASAWFRGGVVAYASDVKYTLLDVPEGPVVSETAAAAMASGVRSVLGADVGLGVTGVAGPDTQDDELPGTVFLAVDGLDEKPLVTRVTLPGDRERVRQFACISLLDLLRHRLSATD
ncbi:MAG TPA: competence/damage-inducible protein A [Acidimicrobiales bacterium]|nr:competence/damage-inducible protein A [Acidimicrobiales bacterium]